MSNPTANAVALLHLQTLGARSVFELGICVSLLNLNPFYRYLCDKFLISYPILPATLDMQNNTMSQAVFVNVGAPNAKIHRIAVCAIDPP
jgi:hypothetical protein